MRWALRLVGSDALGSLSVLCAARSADGRWLAGRRADWVATWAGPLGARRRRRGRGRRGPGAARSRASSRRSGRSCPSGSTSRRSSACPTGWRCSSARPGCPTARRSTRDPEHDAHAWWPADPAAWPRRGAPGPARHGAAAGDRAMTFTQLKWLSFLHSAIYLTLLTVWLVPGLKGAEMVVRLGARDRLDRHVAALHRRGAPARDPAVARRHRGDRRRHRPVRRKRRLRGRGTSTSGLRDAIRSTPVPMAINATTVEVVMPAMGDSVSEGTVLEWHKAEGDSVAVDETIVEISTDKVDAEVPAPIAGTVVKVHAAEGDTVHVGAVLVEIAPVERERPRAAGRARRRRGRAGRRPGPRPRSSTSSCRRWASRSPRARSSSGPSRSARPSRPTTRSSRSPPTRSTPRSPRPPAAR